MVEAGCIYAFMEVGAVHAMVQGRVAIEICRQDLYQHHARSSRLSMVLSKTILYAKKSFFDSLASDAFAIINKDDKNGPVMDQNCKAHVLYHGLKTMRAVQRQKSRPIPCRV